MTLEEISERFYMLTVEYIGGDEGYDAFLKEGLKEKDGKIIFANINGNFYVPASCIGGFMKLNKQEMRKLWYESDKLEAFDNGFMDKTLTKKMRLYDLSPREVYKLNKETVQEYFGVLNQ